MKKSVFALLGIVCCILCLLLGLWNAYRYHREKLNLEGGTRSTLMQIDNAIFFYVCDHDKLPLDLNDLIENGRDLDIDNISDRKIRNISFFNWTSDYERIPFLFCQTVRLDDKDRKPILVAEPIPTDNMRFVLVLPDYRNAEKMKEGRIRVTRIPESEFQQRIKKQGWLLPEESR